MAKTVPEERNPTRVWAGLGVLVAVLAGVVVWSLPGDDPTTGADAGAEDAAIEAAADARPAPRATGALERLPEATCEIALLTDKTPDDLKKVDAEAIEKLLDARTCGDGCELVKRALRDKKTLELDVTTAEQFILPPKEAFEAMGPTLTAAERESIERRPNLLVVRTRGAPSVDQIAARTCFTAAAAAGSALGAIVYDETVRRFETPAQLAQHAIVAAPGKPVFVPRQIAVQLYKHDDGTARLVTLGMARFGAPDFVVRGATLDDGPQVANAINVVAWHAAALETHLPFTVTLADVSQVTGLEGDKLSKDPAASRPLRLEVIDADRAEGDPENDIVELVPPGGATPEGWSDALAALYGDAPQVVRAVDEAALEAAAQRARASLPRALDRFRAGDGALYVKGPFPIPLREDAGPSGFEWLWIEVASCDAKACAGTLSNSPGYATNLAAGKPATVERPKVADWLLRQRDGGTAGGESIRILAKRP